MLVHPFHASRFRLRFCSDCQFSCCLSAPLPPVALAHHTAAALGPARREDKDHFLDLIRVIDTLAHPHTPHTSCRSCQGKGWKDQKLEAVKQSDHQVRSGVRLSGCSNAKGHLSRPQSGSIVSSLLVVMGGGWWLPPLFLRSHRFPRFFFPLSPFPLHDIDLRSRNSCSPCVTREA